MQNLDTLLTFAMAETHKDVIKLFEEGVNLSEFNVYHDSLWSCYVPKNIVNYAPLLSFHSDTVFKTKPKEFLVNDGIITNANPKHGCGWDCRAGCYIGHELIKDGQQYIYLICDLEESGGVGSQAFAKSEVFQSILEKASCFIGLDRRGSEDCASYGFDNDEMFDLMEEYGSYKYAMGSFTDVVNLSEHSTLACCNLSVAYENEHRAIESLNLEAMENTLSFLMEYLPQDFWDKQFLSESKPYTYDWRSYYVEEEAEGAILCDCCGMHKPLYNVSWGAICEDCMKYEELGIL